MSNSLNDFVEKVLNYDRPVGDIVAKRNVELPGFYIPPLYDVNSQTETIIKTLAEIELIPKRGYRNQKHIILTAEKALKRIAKKENAFPCILDGCSLLIGYSAEIPIPGSIYTLDFLEGLYRRNKRMYEFVCSFIGRCLCLGLLHPTDHYIFEEPEMWGIKGKKKKAILKTKKRFRKHLAHMKHNHLSSYIPQLSRWFDKKLIEEIKQMIFLSELAMKEKPICENYYANEISCSGFSLEIVIEDILMFQNNEEISEVYYGVVFQKGHIGSSGFNSYALSRFISAFRETSLFEYLHHEYFITLRPVKGNSYLPKQ